MTAAEIWGMILGSGGIIAAFVLIFKMGRGFQRVETAIESMDRKIDKLDARVGKIEECLTEMRVQIGKLETRVDERTLRVVHTIKDKTRTPDPEPIYAHENVT